MTDAGSVRRAVDGCEVVFNAMGMLEQWLADQRVFDRVNAEGTCTVVEAARDAGARRVVHTSTFRELAQTVVRNARRGRVPPSIPLPMARAFAASGEAVARVIRRKPMLARGELAFLLWNAAPDSSKAQRELSWQPTSVEDGIRRTLQVMGLLT